MSKKEIRERDDVWCKEIAKHLPFLRAMSFKDPHSVVEWLFEHVDIKERPLREKK